MATATLCPSRPPLQLPRSPDPTKSPQSRPRSLQTATPALGRADPPPTRLVLHLNAAAATLTKYPQARGAALGSVQRRFLQRPRRSALGLDHKYGVAETSPFCESGEGDRLAIQPDANRVYIEKIYLNWTC